MAFKFSNLSLPMGSGGNHLDPDTAIIDDLLDDHPVDRREIGTGLGRSCTRSCECHFPAGRGWTAVRRR